MLPAFPSLPKWMLSMPGSPLIWLCVALGLALPATYAVTKIKAAWEIQASYDKGVSAGKGMASASTVAAATETASAANEAEAATPLPADKKAIIELCRKSASCRERGLK